jgi:hypothetical protein
MNSTGLPAPPGVPEARNSSYSSAATLWDTEASGPVTGAVFFSGWTDAMEAMINLFRRHGGEREREREREREKGQREVEDGDERFERVERWQHGGEGDERENADENK